MYNYTRKSFDSHPNSFYENEERKLGQTSSIPQNPPHRARLSSQEKRYDYQSEID